MWVDILSATIYGHYQNEIMLITCTPNDCISTQLNWVYPVAVYIGNDELLNLIVFTGGDAYKDCNCDHESNYQNLIDVRKSSLSYCCHRCAARVFIIKTDCRNIGALGLLMNKQ